MLCIPDQLFNKTHTAESKGLFISPGLLTYVYWLSACALLYLLKFDKQVYSCSTFPTKSNTLHKILIKDNTVIVIHMVFITVFVLDSHYADRDPNVSRTSELFYGIFPD